MVNASNFKSQGPGSNPAGSRIQLETVWCFIAQSLSLSPIHCLDMTNNVERAVKHQIIIKSRESLSMSVRVVLFF